MTERPCTRRVMCLLSVLCLVMTGCDRDAPLPTAVPGLPSALAASTPNLGTGNEAAPEGTHHRDHRHSPRRIVVAEAKAALGELLTGEQAYYQKSALFGAATFTDIADTADARAKLWVDLDGPSERWMFSVSDGSSTGFIARASGRYDTVAEGTVVALHYVRGRPLRWTVRHQRSR